MKTSPCSLCGNTEFQLSDGYYYCHECGTQDTTIRETVVEVTILDDGTVARGVQRTIRTKKKKNFEMPPEWHKWHVYNFILMGWTEEVIALGAAPSLRSKVLWIWTRYMKKYQNTANKGSDVNKEPKENDEDMSDNEFDDAMMIKDPSTRWNKHLLKMKLHIVRKYTLIAIICTALNIDRSDILISDIVRFIKEGRISYASFYKFIPNGIKTRFPEWKSFNTNSIPNYCQKHMYRDLVTCLFESLDLGKPSVPNMRNILDRYIKELCLPDEFKKLVLSLMARVKSRYFNTRRFMWKFKDYETIVMSYILVALKICFGLDDDYEVKLSDAVEKLNEQNDYSKSYKLDSYSEKTGRLFSFREWCNFLQFRKIFLCKYYAPIANRYWTNVDDFVFMEFYDRYKVTHKEYSDELTMRILDKIPEVIENVIIPRSKFPNTLTPRTTYTETISLNVKDFDTKLMLSEDFSQYSLTYVCKDLHLPNLLNNMKNVVVGVSKSNKIIEKDIVGNISILRKYDSKPIFVKNCNNKNWLKTKQPTADHITKIANTETDKSEDSNSVGGFDLENVDKITINNKTNKNGDNVSICGSDLGNDNMMNNNEFSEEGINDGDINISPSKPETIEEEDLDTNIFDDNFSDLEDKKDDKFDYSFGYQQNNRIFNETILSNGSIVNAVSGLSADQINIENNSDNLLNNNSIRENADSETALRFNPNVLNREDVIKELVLLECKRLRIPIPLQYRDTEPTKGIKRRYNPTTSNKEAQESRKKKRKSCNSIDELINIYNNIISRNQFNNITEGDLNHISDTGLNNISNANGQLANPEDLAFENISHVPGSHAENDNISLSTAREQCTGDNDSTREDLSVIFVPNDLNTKLGNSDETMDQFNENEHDMRQLYVKFQNKNLELNDIFKEMLHDPMIEDILNKPNAPDKSVEDESVTDNNLAKRNNLKQVHGTNEKQIPLFKNLKIKKFNYWARRYCFDKSKLKMLHMDMPFDLELEEYLPKSFSFVLRECVSMVETDYLDLYKYMMHLEKLIMR